MELPAHKMSVDYDYLVSLLGERLLTKVGGASAESEFSAIMEAMPRLQTGLDVNVLFDGVFDFDRTPEMQIFQWLGVQLCHCWLPDPADPALYDVVHGHTYDRLVEMVVAGQEASLKLKQGALGGALGTPEASDSGAGGAGTSAAAGADTLATLEREVRLGEKVEQFLELSRSQLTYYGRR